MVILCIGIFYFVKLKSYIVYCVFHYLITWYFPPVATRLFGDFEVGILLTFKVAEHWYFLMCVSVTFFSKNLYPLDAKNGSKQGKIKNFDFLMVKLTYVTLPWQHG